MYTDNPVDLNTVRLSLLTYESQSLLSLLLNTKKVLPSDGPDKLPRDWRGLATLLNISSEIAASINDSPDKTAKVLDIWIKRNDGSATVGQLLSHLRRIDRHDVCDDILGLANQKQLYAKPTNPTSVALPPPRSSTDSGLITYDDVRCGAPQIYDAFVLYANEDRDFVEDLLDRMKTKGFKLCTTDDLLPGHATQHAPVAKLLSERCHRIIFVYSPEFFSSSANKFYTDYAQAIDIESDTLKIMPLMYRDCQLPPQHAYYYKLYYSPPGQKSSYNFWDRLSQSLDYSRALTGVPVANGLKITELTSSHVNLAAKNHSYLALPEIPRSSSFTELTTTNTTAPLLIDSISLSGNVKKKKKNSVKNFFSSALLPFKGKKVKKAVAVEN